MATDSGVLRFLAYARGDRPRTADWRTLQQAFIREEITLDCLHHLTAEDIDDLVPLSCRAAYDATYQNWLGKDPDLMASLPAGADQIWDECGFDAAAAPAPPPAPEPEPKPEPEPSFARDFLAKKAQEWDASGGRRRPDDLDDQSVASAAAASVASAATSAAATVATRIDADAADASRAPAVADPRDVRDAVLHGEKAPQEDGRWLYTHRGQCYLMDALSQRCLATWEASPAPRAELPPPDDDAPEEIRGPSELLRQTTRPVAPASRAPSAREARKESQRAKKEARLAEKEAARLAEAAAAESARLEKEARRRDKERLRREAEQTRRNDERLAKEAARDEKAARDVAVEVSERQAREARAAKEAEKQRRAAASAVAAEEEAARAAAVARSQREAREARAARDAERARAALAARREAEKARREAFAQQTVVEEDEEEDEDAAARREAVERSRREAAEERERRAAVERSRREAAEERERQRRELAARIAAAKRAAEETLARDRDGMAREDAASHDREVADDCAREAELAAALAAARDRRAHAAAAGARLLATPLVALVAIAAYYALTWFVAGRGRLVAAGAVPAFWPSASGMFVAARGALAWAVAVAGGALAWPTSFKGSGAYALAITLLMPVFAYYLHSKEERAYISLRYAYWNADWGRLLTCFAFVWGGLYCCANLLAWAVTGAGGALAPGWPMSFKACGVYALTFILLLPVFQYCFQFRALPSIRDLGVLLYGQGLNMQFAQGLAVVWVVLYGVANAVAFTLASSENIKFVACGVGFVLVLWKLCLARFQEPAMYIVGAVGGVFLSSFFGVLVESLYSVCLEAGRPAAYSVLEVLAWAAAHMLEVPTWAAARMLAVAPWAAARMLAMPPWALLVAFAVFWLRPIASYLAKGASLTEAVREARIASGAVEAPEDRRRAAAADRRREEVDRVLRLDDARVATESAAAPRQAHDDGKAALQRLVDLFSLDFWVRKGLMVEAGSFVDDPDTLRALLEEAVATLNGHKATLRAAADACERAMAPESRPFDAFARDVLGVNAKADGAEVRRAARRLALSCHPDKLRAAGRGLRLRAATTYRLVTLCRDALAEDDEGSQLSQLRREASPLAAAQEQWARSHGFDDGTALAPLRKALELAHEAFDDQPAPEMFRTRLRCFSRMPCVCGRQHPKVRVNLAAYGLWRVDNHRDVVRSAPRRGRFRPGQGFAAPRPSGRGYAMLLIDAFDEHVYDVTEWAVCRFKLRHYELETIQFTSGEPRRMRESQEIWRRRRAATGWAAEEAWAEDAPPAPPPRPRPPAPKQRQKKPGTGKKGKRRR